MNGIDLEILCKRIRRELKACAPRALIVQEIAILVLQTDLNVVREALAVMLEVGIVKKADDNHWIIA